MTPMDSARRAMASSPRWWAASLFWAAAAAAARRSGCVEEGDMVVSVRWFFDDGRIIMKMNGELGGARCAKQKVTRASIAPSVTSSAVENDSIIHGNQYKSEI